MASVDEVRQEVARAKDKADESLAKIQEAITSLDEARTALHGATHDSAQDDVHQAYGSLSQAVSNLTAVQGAIRSGITQAEGYAGRL